MKTTMGALWKHLPSTTNCPLNRAGLSPALGSRAIVKASASHTVPWIPKYCTNAFITLPTSKLHIWCSPCYKPTRRSFSVALAGWPFTDCSNFAPAASCHDHCALSFLLGAHWRVPKRLMSPCNFCLPFASQPCSQHYSFKAVTRGVTGDPGNWEPSFQVVCPGEMPHAMGRRRAELGPAPGPRGWEEMASTSDAAISI